MDKESVKATLRAHEPELRLSGIVHLHLHGSVVRGEAGPSSDVDLAAVFDRNKVRSPLAEIRLARELSELLGITVDLANETTLKAEVRVDFEREAEFVFQGSGAVVQGYSSIHGTARDAYRRDGPGTFSD